MNIRIFGYLCAALKLVGESGLSFRKRIAFFQGPAVLFERISFLRKRLDFALKNRAKIHHIGGKGFFLKPQIQAAPFCVPNSELLVALWRNSR